MEILNLLTIILKVKNAEHRRNIYSISWYFLWSELVRLHKSMISKFCGPIKLIPLQWS